MWCQDLGRDVEIAICNEDDCAYRGTCKIFLEREVFEENASHAIYQEMKKRRYLDQIRE